MKTNVAGYSYDITTNTLTVSADFAKRASQLNTPEYRIVKQMRAEYAGLIIQRRTRKPTPARPRIKYADMERYMKMCRTADRYLFVFGKVKELSKGQPNPYEYVLTWFKALFPHYSEHECLEVNATYHFKLLGFSVTPKSILSIYTPSACSTRIPSLALTR